MIVVDQFEAWAESTTSDACLFGRCNIATATTGFLVARYLPAAKVLGTPHQFHALPARQ
jgi:hypothetical protein